MGLKNLFRKDVGGALHKAAAWLEAGDAVRALDAARRHIQDREPQHRERAQDLVARSRQALVQSSLEKAEAAEAAGDPADAADWLRAALQHVTDDARRDELEAQRADLERRAEIGERDGGWESAVRQVEEDEEPDLESVAVDSAGGDDPDPAADSGDESEVAAAAELAARLEETEPSRAPDPAYDPVEAEIRYSLLVDTLSDDLAARYDDRSEEFRAAYLAINDGEPAVAVVLLDSLVEAQSDDPVLRLERGRCRLMLGDAPGARQDLELAWEELGDDPLDRAESLRLPSLWAEAALESADPGPVLERLHDLARPENGDPDLTAVYGSALVQDGRLAEARRFLARAIEVFPKRPDLPLALAQVLATVDERQLAIDLLERSIAPSCAGGNCGQPPLHLPSLRALAALHLGMRPQPAVSADEPATTAAAAFAPTATNLDRVEDLMRWIAGAQGGRLSGVDHLLAAQYHELVGDEARAEEARRRAAQQADHAVEVAAGPGNLVAATGEAAL